MIQDTSRCPVRPSQSAARSDRTTAMMTAVTMTNATALMSAIAHAVSALLHAGQCARGDRTTTANNGRNRRLSSLTTP